MALRFTYGDNIDSGGAYLFTATPGDYALFAQDGYEPLPPLPVTARAEFILAYKESVRACVALNQGSLVDLTPFAAFNTWQSTFYHGLESAWRLKSLGEGVVLFRSPEWFVWAAGRFAAEIDPRDLRRARVAMRRVWLQCLRDSWHGIRFALSRRAPQKAMPSGLQILMAGTWTPAGLERWRGARQDPYFSDIPALAGELGYETATVYHAEGDHASRPLGGRVFDITSGMKLSDWIFIMFSLLLFRPRVPSSAAFPVDAVRHDLSRARRAQLPLALISLRAGLRFLRANPEASLLLPYEGNCWERGLWRAARMLNRRISACQHTAFAPSFLKMCAMAGGPDLLISSGPGSARLLTDVMGHESHRVISGCALRFSPLPEIREPAPRGSVLVMLQGAPDDALFLKLVMRSLRAENLIVRAHPSWSPPAGFSDITSRDDLAHDLARSRVAIYTGTTACFEALSAGVPVIHADLGSALCTDPLSGMADCAVRKTWQAGMELAPVLSALDSLGADARKSGFSQARSYISGFFAAPEEKIKRHMIEKVVYG